MLDSIDTLIAFTLIFTVVSLFITILVQMITAYFNMRGKNLVWGVAEAFEAIAPELKSEVRGKGKELADHLLKDPLLSDSQIRGAVKLTSAVRADELFDLMHRIATNKKPGTPEEIKKNVITLFKSLGVPDSVFTVAEAEMTKLTDLKANLEKAVQALPDGPAKEAANTALQETTTKLANMTTDAAASAKRWSDQGEKSIQLVYEKFEHWFETGQERSQEWFTTHARILTAYLGVAFALVLQLDTVEIYKLVSSNREVRASLVAQVKPVIDQNEKILRENPTVMQSALKNLEATTKGGTNPAAVSLKDIQIAVTDTPEMVKDKIRTAYAGAPVETRDAVLKQFDDETLTEAQARVKISNDDWNALKGSIDKAGFELLPKDGWRWAKRDRQGKVVENPWWDHLPGMLLSALLLSLGAPFWFNVLKGLASLRSTVAQNISDKDKVDLKGGKVDQAGKAPPTTR